eukprot:m.85898 g.85898  ORF g.85898 m.85898 type:complete len:54 (+) comp13030_c0_seq1:29-190(+)
MFLLLNKDKEHLQQSGREHTHETYNTLAEPGLECIIGISKEKGTYNLIAWPVS